jgi:MYXO-CTERM domain-containing protein
MALPQCGGSPETRPVGRSSQAILGGTVVDAAQSPFLYIEGPEGACTGTLIGPALVATARHCVAELSEGTFSCDASGNLIGGGIGGQIGIDNSPGAISFYLSSEVVAGQPLGPPQAVGLQILSTQTPTVCADDLAFVVLNQGIPGIAPAPIRLGGTQVGETVSVWGYGLTDQPEAPTELRVRDDAQIVGVGPPVATTTTQAAPLRAVRVGPGAVTCNGDSGGPMTSAATGAVVAVVSLGEQASTGPFCSDSTESDTTGPLLADYSDLVLAAFQAAGQTPILEAVSDAASSAPDGTAEAAPSSDSDADSDAALESEGDAADDAGPSLLEAGSLVSSEAGSSVGPSPVGPSATDSTGPFAYAVSGGSCSMGSNVGARSIPRGLMALAVGVAAVARRRRR